MAAVEALSALADPPTGLCCGNDHLAAMVYGILRARGIAVPEGMSVGGSDDSADLRDPPPAAHDHGAALHAHGRGRGTADARRVRGAQTMADGTRIEGLRVKPSFWTSKSRSAPGAGIPRHKITNLNTNTLEEMKILTQAA